MSPSTSMALHREKKNVYMPCQYHALSCPCSRVLTMRIASQILATDCILQGSKQVEILRVTHQNCRGDGVTLFSQILCFVPSFETCVWPCTVILKQDFCGTLPQFCQHTNVDARVYFLFSWHCICKNHT